MKEQDLCIDALAEVKRRTTLSRATIYRLIAKGEFPAPIKLLPNRVGWIRDEITDWLEQRCAESRA